jgi:hypothetical protein
MPHRVAGSNTRYTLHPVSTFIVRIWLERSESGSCWRGQIEHLQSRQRCAFLNLEEMVTFIRGYVTMRIGTDKL